MMNPKMLSGILKQFLPYLEKLPLHDQSAQCSEFERLLTKWFREKKLSIDLHEGETDLVLMFRETNDILVMIPAIINNKDKISRVLVDHGINVTAMATRIPLPTIIPTFLGSEPTEESKNEVEAKVLETLQNAARHESCRLRVKTGIDRVPTIEN